MGPSGSEESTLLNLIGGLDQPTSGELFIDHRPLHGISDDELTLMILGVDVLQDGNIREYKLSNENSDFPDPLHFLARPDSILLTRDMAEREGITRGINTS